MPTRPSTSRGATGQRRPHVALIVETSLGAGREILRGIAQYLREHGPWSIYHEPRSLEQSVPAWLRRWRGDGIIARIQDRRIARALAATGLPTVDVLGAVPRLGVPLVHVDNTAIARMAADHLLERGFRQFAYCGVEGATWSQQRETTFAERAAAAGCPCAVYRLPAESRGERSWEQEQQRLARWLARLPRPAGVMACHDPRGQRVLEACRRAGILVPDEMAVIGVDDDQPVCEVADPPLSSVVPDFRGIGYEAAGLLESLMGGERPSSSAAAVYLPPLGIAQRQSTDALAIEDREIAEAARFIREHAHQPLGVEDVARHVLVSRSVLKRRFRQAMGRSVHEEIIRVRLKRVQELLARTDLPLRSVALKSGFRHQEYMGVSFKAHLGLTPGQYRRRFGHGPKPTNFRPRSP